MSAETTARPSLTLHRRFWATAYARLRSAAPLRILEVGCGRGESLALLLKRKIEAFGFDLGAAAGQLLAPKNHFAFGSLSSAMSYPQHHFDLIVVRPTPSFRGELATAEHYVATANLLSCVKPLGRLMIVEPAEGRDGIAVAEWIDRWQKHLHAFTAERVRGRYRDGLGWWLSLSFLGKASPLDLETITLTVPEQPVSRLEWHRQARAAVMPRTKNARHRAA